MTTWKTEKLSNLLAVSIGGIWGEEAGLAEIDVSVVRVTELKAHGRIDPSSSVTRSVTLKQLASRELQEGDLLLEKSGGGPNSPVGRVGYFFQEGTRTVCSNFMQLMRPDSTKVLPKYLFHFLDGFHSNGGTIPMQTATTNIRNIKTPQYMDIDVPVPSIDEQHKIVELLEDHLSRLDVALADVKQAKISAAQFRRSLLQAAFTGNLGSGGTSFKSKLPDGWETKRLDEIADIVMGQSPPGSSYNEHGEGQPFFQGKTEFGEVHPTVRKYTTAGTKFAKAGDILMSVRAPVGPTNIADIDCVIGRGLAAIRAKTVVSQDYLRWSLKHLEIDIQSKGTGTTFDAITGETLRGTLVALPPIDEQHKIVELLQEHLSRLDASISLADSMERQSNGLRRSLLQAAFTGQLTKEVASV